MPEPQTQQNPNPQPQNSGGTPNQPTDPNPKSQQQGDPKGGGQGSIYADVGLDEPGAKGSTAWPENWRLDMAGGDEKLAKQLERYQNPGDVSKALLAAQQRIRSGEYRRVTPPPDGKDEAALAAWREENGLPKDAAEYSFDGVVEGFSMEKADPTTKAALTEFQKTFHGANLTKDQAAGVMKGITAVTMKQMEEQAIADAEYGDTAEDTLRAEWGAEYRKNVEANLKFLKQKLGDEGALGLLRARTPDGRILGDNPALSKLINEMVRMDGGDEIYGGGGDAKGVDSRIAEIQALMGTDGYTNAIADEYQKLIEKREARAARQ